MRGCQQVDTRLALVTRMTRWLRDPPGSPRGRLRKQTHLLRIPTDDRSKEAKRGGADGGGAGTLIVPADVP